MGLKLVREMEPVLVRELVRALEPVPVQVQVQVQVQEPALAKEQAPPSCCCCCR